MLLHNLWILLVQLLLWFSLGYRLAFRLSLRTRFNNNRDSYEDIGVVDALQIAFEYYSRIRISQESLLIVAHVR